MLRKCLVGIVYTALFISTASAANDDPRLSLAAMRGDKAGMETLLKQNADINGAQGDGTTALHWAAYRDDIAMTQLLLKAGAKLEVKTRVGELTPLFMAAKNGNPTIIELMLKAGAVANFRDSNGTTPLMFAAASGNPEAVKVLLDRGAEINAKDDTNGQTALMFAASLDRAAVIKLLAGRGADVNVVSKVLEPAVRDFRSRNDGQAGRRETKGPWIGGLTALHFAAREGQMNAVRELVAAGADVNVVAASDKMSVMTMAIINGQFDMAKFLLDHNANPNLANTGGLTPLYATVDQQWAARTWYPPANVEQQKTGYLDLIQDLLAHGADPNAKMGPKLWFRTFHGDWVDPEGATAFWRAAQANDLPVMKLLVAKGADFNLPSAHGCSPLQAAAGYGYEPQVSYFAPHARLATLKYLVEELGANVNSRDDKGYTPLHGAALMGDNELINFLVAKGGDVKARASMVYGRADDTNKDVAQGTGDTVADMADGPRERNLVYPETIALLEKLGSPNSHNCRASTCVLNTLPDKSNQKKPQ